MKLDFLSDHASIHFNQMNLEKDEKMEESKSMKNKTGYLLYEKLLFNNG
jgi:hypothetical protein